MTASSGLPDISCNIPMEERRSLAPPRWRVFRQQWLGIMIAALGFVTLACGLGGFSLQYENLYEAQVAAVKVAAEKGHKEPDPVYDWSVPVYKTFQLFLLNSGAEDDPDHPVPCTPKWSSSSMAVTV